MLNVDIYKYRGSLQVFNDDDDEGYCWSIREENRFVSNNCECICVCVCTCSVPYRLWTADDALHYVVSDLLPVILMNIERKDDFSERWLPVLPVLTHHVLQIDGRYTHTHTHTYTHTHSPGVRQACIYRHNFALYPSR